MEKDIKGDTRRIKNEEIYDLKELGTFISSLGKQIEKLDSAVKILPIVDEKGKSECPFAEQLYLQKEEAEDKLNEYIEKGPKYVDLLSKEISKGHQNLRQVESDHPSLNSPQAKEKYKFAIHAQKQNILKNRDQLQKLKDIISKALELIQKSKLKQWPLGKPKERNFGFSNNTNPPKALHDRGLSGPSIKTEANSLISIGPLSGRGVYP